MLIQLVIVEKVQTSIKIMPKEKAPVVDGFSIEFLTTCWDGVQNDLLNVVFHLFNTSEMGNDVNYTVVSLAPKITAPTM